jgi:hypothetical protein
MENSTNENTQGQAINESTSSLAPNDSGNANANKNQSALFSGFFKFLNPGISFVFSYFYSIFYF